MQSQEVEAQKQVEQVKSSNGNASQESKTTSSGTPSGEARS
jgi:hypothetical protein